MRNNYEENKSCCITQNGDADQMIWEEINLPDPNHGQVLLKHEFVGFNMIDVYHRSGIYPTPS